jgi:hypothetical protein
MKNIFLLLIASAIFSSANAQLIKEKQVNVSLGLGITIPYNDEDIRGQGFYTEGEYVMTVASWLQLRPYAGFIYTDTYEDDLSLAQADFELKTTAFFTGGKVRFIAPVPWFAPYLEFGIGLSAGTFESRTFEYNFKKSGVFYHVPLSIGILLGKDKNFDVAFKYLDHPTTKQVIGAAAIGLSFPIN